MVIPIGLIAVLAWGIAVASRRTGEPASAKRRALTVVLIAVVWMTTTWVAAASGVLRRWDATPPPFALLVVGVVLLAFLIAFGGYVARGGRAPRWVVAAWNVAGLALLINVVTIAIVSTPRIAYFGADRSMSG